MRIVDRLRAGSTRLLLRVLPAEDRRRDSRSLYRTIQDLERLSPDFVSVTWGAGGSTRRKTVEIVIQIQRDTGHHGHGSPELHRYPTPTSWRRRPRPAGAGRSHRERPGPGRRPDPRATSRRPTPSATPTSWWTFMRSSRWSFCLGARRATRRRTRPHRGAEADLENLRQQGGRRRRLPDHPALLRQCGLSSTSWSAARGRRASRCPSFPASCRS